MVLCPLRATSAWSASPPLMPGPTWAPPLAGRLRPARGLLAGRRMPCRPPRKWCTPMPTGGQRPRHPSAWHCQPLPRGHGWTKSPPAGSCACRGRASPRDVGSRTRQTKRADPWPPTFLCPTWGGYGQSSRPRCFGTGWASRGSLWKTAASAKCPHRAGGTCRPGCPRSAPGRPSVFWLGAVPPGLAGRRRWRLASRRWALPASAPAYGESACDVRGQGSREPGRAMVNRPSA